jgi:arylsulfatase A-like enzyme
VILEQNRTAEKIGEYSHDLFTKESLAFIRDHRDTSFFLYLGYTIPHSELTVPEDSKLPYKGRGWPERPMKPGHYHHDPEGNTTYAGMVSRMDRDVGKILSLLKELGIDENTLVVFTSDNGHQYDNGFLTAMAPSEGKKETCTKEVSACHLQPGGLRK